MTKRPKVAALSIAGVIILLFTVCPWSGSRTAEAAPVSQANPKLVLAFYYTWFGPADFGQWADARHAGRVLRFYPGRSIERQVREAAGAGIDGFITTWLGIDTPSDASFARVLDVAVQHNFKATVYFETIVLPATAVCRPSCRLCWRSMLTTPRFCTGIASL